MRRALLLILLTASVLTACESGDVTVVVNLRTDLVAGAEFDAVRVTVDDASPMERAVELDAVYEEGVRIAEYPSLPVGTYRVEMTLLADGVEVIRQPRIVEVQGPRSLTVLITRDCRDIPCPVEGGDAEATACLAGECVVPECTPETPEACPEPECTGDGDCMTTSMCQRARCADGVCLFPDNGTCGSGSFCGGAIVGCQRIPVPSASRTVVFPSGSELFGGVTAMTSVGNDVIIAGEIGGAVDLGGTVTDHPFVARLSRDGDVVWLMDDIEYGATIDDLECDTAATCFAAGSFSEGLGVDGLSATDVDGFVVEIDPSGIATRAVVIGGAGEVHAHGIGLDDLGNVLVAGHYDGATDFGGPGGALTFVEGYEAFVVRVDRGTFALTDQRTLEGTGLQIFDDVVVDGAVVYVAGSLSGSSAGGVSIGGTEGASIVRMSEDLQTVDWIARDDVGDFNVSLRIQMAGDRPVIAGGTYGGDLAGVLGQPGDLDIFVGRATAAGMFDTGRTMGGRGEDVVHDFTVVDGVGYLAASVLSPSTDPAFPGGGGYDALVYRTDGTSAEVAVSISQAGNQEGQGVAVLDSGDIVMAGTYVGELRGGGGQLAPPGGSGIFVRWTTPPP